MRAVILAAGEGKRMRPHFSGPKPLIRLLGLSLIERNILSLRESGIHEFIIITGRYNEELQEYLGDGSKYNIRITYLHNSDWELGNGVSAHTFHKLYQPGEKFLLLMADHLFDIDIFKNVLNESKTLKDDEILLVADNRLDHVFDLEECTKVKAVENYAIELGKKLDDFNAVDCGLFIGSGSLLDALSEAIAKNKYTLTDGVNELASRQKVKLYFVNGLWMDVDDLPSYRYAEKMLLKSLVPPKDGLISRTINRKFSLRITKIISHYPITPNQITVASFFISLAAANFFAFGFPLLGGILAQLSSIVDGVDGEISRLKFLKSKFGGLFDSVLDRYADFFIVFGMAYAWYSETNHLFALIISALVLTGIPMSMLFKEKFHSITGKPYISETHDGIFHYLPANRDGRLFIIFLGGIFNLIPLALTLLAIFTHLLVVVRLYKARTIM